MSKNIKLNKNIIKLRKLLNSQLTFPFLLFAVTLVLYTHHLSPGVYGTDSGDFISAALTRGVPHPSGYPLITILGILFIKLPIPATPAWKMGLISVLSSSASVAIFYLINLQITKKRIISLISSLMLAFTYTFWLYAEVVEVFALHNLLILLAVYLSINLYQSKNIKYLYTLIFILGLSLTNNLSIVLIFPAIAVLILTNKDLLKLLLNPKIIIKCIIPFLLGLIPYLYIPIAARQNPYINWGMPINLENFLYLVLRKKYTWGVSTKQISTTASNLPLDSLYTYINYLKTYISPLVIVFSFIGFIALFKKDKKSWLFLLTLLIFLGPIFLIQSWRSNEHVLMLGILERFYLSSIIIIMILVAPGLSGIINAIKHLLQNPTLKKFTLTLTYSVLSIIPITFLILNYQRTNLSKNYYYDNLAYEILTPIPENSFLVFISDAYSFSSAYIRSASNFRTNIEIIGSNTGYKPLLEKTNIVSKDNIENYLIENKNSLEDETLLRGLAQLIDKGYLVYAEQKITFEDEDIGKVVPIPYGLVFQLVKEKNIPDRENFEENYMPSFSHINPNYLLGDSLFDDNIILADLKFYYFQFYENLGEFLIEQYNDYNTGLLHIGKSFEYFQTPNTY